MSKVFPILYVVGNTGYILDCTILAPIIKRVAAKIALRGCGYECDEVESIIWCSSSIQQVRHAAAVAIAARRAWSKYVRKESRRNHGETENPGPTITYDSRLLEQIEVDWPEFDEIDDEIDADAKTCNSM